MSPLNVNADKKSLGSKPKEVVRDSALSVNELNQSVPVSVADDDEAEEEDYFVVEGNESEEEKDNI